MCYKICARYTFVPLQIYKDKTWYVLMRITGIFPIFFIVSRLKPYQGQCSKYPNLILFRELTQMI